MNTKSPENVSMLVFLSQNFDSCIITSYQHVLVISLTLNLNFI